MPFDGIRRIAGCSCLTARLYLRVLFVYICAREDFFVRNAFIDGTRKVAIMKECFMCSYNEGEIISFTDEVLAECKQIISFCKENKYLIDDLFLPNDAIDMFLFFFNYLKTETRKNSEKNYANVPLDVRCSSIFWEKLCSKFNNKNCFFFSNKLIFF